MNKKELEKYKKLRRTIDFYSDKDNFVVYGTVIKEKASQGYKHDFGRKAKEALKEMLED